MNTKELLEMNQNDIDEICNGACGTNQCPFKKSLRECREDGFCIKQTYKNINRWIEEDEENIQNLKDTISLIRKRIAKYKCWKGKLENEIHK